MSFSFKYLSLLYLLTNSTLTNANNMSFYEDDIYSNIEKIDTKQDDYCDCIVYIPRKGTYDYGILISEKELEQNYPIIFNNDEFSKHYVFDSYLKSFKVGYSYDANQKKVNEKRLSINISHSIFLFRQLIASIKQLIKEDIYHNSLTYMDVLCFGFYNIFEYIIDQLINYKASNSKLPEQTIREETQQKLINFKYKYKYDIYGVLFVSNAKGTNTLNTIYNEFDGILTEENNNISHSFDPWYKNLKYR